MFPADGWSNLVALFSNTAVVVKDLGGTLNFLTELFNNSNAVVFKLAQSVIFNHVFNELNLMNQNLHIPKCLCLNLRTAVFIRRDCGGDVPRCLVLGGVQPTVLKMIFL